MRKLLASDASLSDFFGFSVAVSGDTAVVGAVLQGPGGSFGPGAAYVFQRDQGGADNWGEVSKLKASDLVNISQFGHGAAVSGDTAVVGARYAVDAGVATGAAYVFDLLQPKPTPCPTEGCPTPTVTPTVTPTPTKQPDPGDTDGDGCSDAQENGPNEALGGLRDYLNPWDFYDTDGSRNVDLFTDIFGVALMFGDPSPPTTHDRGAVIGPNPWNIAGPDGMIDLFNDIFGVAFQFGHNCN